MIIDFKRPGRVGFSEDDNPISQVLDYVGEITNGKAKTPRGRTVNVHPNTAFYCYVLCDLTPKMKKLSEQATLLPTPDGLGYMGFNTNYNAYLEVISYDKLVHDAKKRNRIFFDKLNIPLY